MSYDAFMQVWLFLFVTGFCVLLSFATRAPLPVLVLASVAFAHSVYFSLTGVFGIVPDSISHWWHFRQGITGDATWVTAIFAGQAILATAIGLFRKPLALILTGRRSGSFEDGYDFEEGRSRFFPRAEADESASNTQMILLTGLGGGFLALAAWHAVTVDWQQMRNHEIYLWIRDPSNAGIYSLPLAAFHRTVSQLGLLCLLAARFAYSRNRLQYRLFLLCGLYGFVISLAFCSRISAGYVGLYMFIWPGARSPTMRLIGRSLIGVFALTVYLTILSVRTSGTFLDGERVGDYGLVPAITTWFSFGYFNAKTFAILFASLFGSGYQLQAAVGMQGDIAFPLRYELVSFSPLPSAIDGYRNLADNFSVRPLETGPYSSFSEAILFGPLWVLVFGVLLSIATVFATIAFERRRDAIGTAVLITFAIGVIYLQTYPIRSSVRMLYITIILSMFALYGDRFRLRRSTPNLE